MRLPKSFPDGTTYVVEARGAMIRRYVVFPNGRKVNLRSRKPVRCDYRDANVSIVPERSALDAPVFRRLPRIFWSNGRSATHSATKGLIHGRIHFVDDLAESA